MPERSLSFTILLDNLSTALRLGLTRLLQSQPDLHVVSAGTTELLAVARRLRPGLVIVGESQLRDVEQLSRYTSIPALLYCEGQPLPGMLREAARWGVFDTIRPNSAAAEWSAEVLRKVRRILPQKSAKAAARLVLKSAIPGISRGLVVIGGSTGGTAAVEQLVRGLPASLAYSVLVAVHLPASFLNSFVERLRRATSLPVVAGWPGTVLEPGHIVVAPGGRNLLVKAAANSPWQAWQTEYTAEPSPSGDEPSVDLLMRSAARTVGSNVLGVVLTGLGRDGTLGAQAIRQHGGMVLVQDEASSAQFSMPQSVIQHGWANAVLPLGQLAAAITRHASFFSLPVAETLPVGSFPVRSFQL